MHGIGNDFVFVDAIAQNFSGTDWGEIAIKACHRRFGVGSDGLIILEKGNSAPLRMTMYNPDGSLGGMCGNGIRCLAVWASHLGYVQGSAFYCETAHGTSELQLLGEGVVRVDMGPADFGRTGIGFVAPHLELVEFPLATSIGPVVGTAVSLGNPHFVAFVDDVDGIVISKVGPEIENHPMFPSRINVHFATARSGSEASQRTWERGAGETLACGSGACSVVAAGVRIGVLERRTTVRLPGGSLEIEYDETGHLWMTGPTAFVFSGSMPI